MFPHPPPTLLRRRARRAIATATAALLLAVQVGTYAHLITVRHEVCGQHGELVDVHGGSAPPAAAPERPSADEARLLASTTVLGPHDHEHCALAQHRRESGSFAPDHQASCPAPPAFVPAFPAYERPAAALDAVYRIAPKNSPPA